MAIEKYIYNFNHDHPFVKWMLMMMTIRKPQETWHSSALDRHDRAGSGTPAPCCGRVRHFTHKRKATIHLIDLVSQAWSTVYVQRNIYVYVYVYFIYIYVHTHNPFYHLGKISKFCMLLVTITEAHKIDLGRLQA